MDIVNRLRSAHTISQQAIAGSTILLDAAQEIERLRVELRRFAVVEHVRLAVGGGTVPNGWSCKLCRTEGSQGEAVKHTDNCLLNNPVEQIAWDK